MAFGKKKDNEKKVKIQTVAMSQNPLYHAQQENEVKEVLTALATAAVCIILFALIVTNFSDYSTGYSYSGGGSSPAPDPEPPVTSGVVQDNPDDSDNTDDTGEEEQNEIDMSLVDIDGVHNDYLEIGGKVSDAGYGELYLQTEQSQNIYVYDSASGEDILAEDVNEIRIDENSSVAVDQYVDGSIVAGGSLYADNRSVVFRIENLISGEVKEDDPGVHNYQVVVEDCTWQEALQRSIDQGGHLLRLNSPEEYEYIAGMLSDGGYTDIHFYLGGRREGYGTEYYWVDDNNQFMGEVLNSMSSWCDPYWFDNEPSYEDTGSDAAGAITEDVMNLFYVSGTWYLNDSSSDLAGMYPDLLSGKVGYIIEFE